MVRGVGIASALTATESADKSPLPNVSYDLTRGLYQQFDAAFINLDRQRDAVGASRRPSGNRTVEAVAQLEMTRLGNGSCWKAKSVRNSGRNSRCLRESASLFVSDPSRMS